MVADYLVGSDVQPCVWAIVESGVAIFCACLPTFPALFHIKSIREKQRPSSDPRSIPSLGHSERRSGHMSNVTDSRKEILRMEDWTEGSQTEKGNAISHVHGETDSV